jgi:hypothetical protein
MRESLRLFEAIMPLTSICYDVYECAQDHQTQLRLYQGEENRSRLHAIA